MKIRRAEIGDEKDIANVIINTWKNAYRNIVPDDFLMSLNTEKHEQLFKEHIKEKKETIIILENNEGKIIAMVSGGKDRSGCFDCEIAAIYVLPEYQKQGYGKQLFKYIIEDYKKNNYKSMIIWTFEKNKDQKFYVKLGGTIQKTSNYIIGGKEIPLVGYVWQDINIINTQA